MSSTKPKPVPGIETRHRKDCRTRAGGGCNCQPSYRARFSGPSGRIVSPWFPTLAAAKNWRIDTQARVKQGVYFEPTRITLEQAAHDFIQGARAGTVLNRKGARYRPSVVRDYDADLSRHVLPTLGAKRLSDIRRADVQQLVDALHARGLAPSTVRNALDPLRRIFDRAVKRDVVPFSPCQSLDVPRGTGRRERVASPSEAALLIATLHERDRALWAMAFYAGLRMGELRALRWADIDLDANIIRVRRNWDDKEGEQDGGKTLAAVRDVMLIAQLRPFLVAHRLLTGRRDGLVLGATADKAMVRSTIRSRALAAWTAANERTRGEAALRGEEVDAKSLLQWITPHEGRHTFASILAAAGIDAGERQRQMGHTSATMMDRYTHGLDGSIAAASTRVQAFLDAQAAS